MQTVTAAIIERNGKYLLARRREGDTMGGYWEFPGGGVDDGETPDMCVVRELSEELGVKARAVSLFDAMQCADGKMVVLFYRCEIEGEPQPLDCDELRWVNVDEIADYRLLPGDIAIARRLAGNS